MKTVKHWWLDGGSLGGRVYCSVLCRAMAAYVSAKCDVWTS